MDDDRPKLIYLVTEDWYFWSHRLPMARAARDAGFAVAVATRVDRHGDAIRSEGFGLHPLSWRRGRRGDLDPRALADITALYRRERPALVHHVALKPVVYGALAARFAGVPAVINALTGLGHVFLGRSVRARLLRFGAEQVLRGLLNRPNSRLVLQNPDDRDEFVSRGLVAPARVRLVRGSGVDIEHFRSLPMPPAPPMVCAVVARMLASKGVDTAVAAVRLARQRGIDVRLVLAGLPDPDNPATIPRARLDAWAAEDGIDWLGHADDVRMVWRTTHVAILPSLREGFPKSLLEAAACGRPIVATDVPGCREIVVPEENGVLVPPGDAAALAAVLGRLAADPALWGRWGARSRALMEADLSADAIGRSMVAVYRDLMSPTAAGLPPTAR